MSNAYGALTLDDMRMKQIPFILLSVIAGFGCSEQPDHQIPVQDVEGHMREIENAEGVYLATDEPGDGKIVWVVEEVLRKPENGNSPISIGYEEKPMDPSPKINYPDQILILSVQDGDVTTSLSVFEGSIHTDSGSITLEEIRELLTAK